MRVDSAKVKLTIPIPINKPDGNGVIYTRDAVESAVNNLRKNLPIVYADNECEARAIGVTTGDSHIVTWDEENQVCNVTVDGIVFYSGASIIVDEIEDGKVSSFEITSFGLTI